MNMPRIEISDHDFKRLQNYAEPFVDTPSTALTKVLDRLEVKTRPSETNQPVITRPQGKVTYGPTSLPPLKHTKFLSGRLGTQEPVKNTWNSMVALALQCLFDKFGDVQKVRIASGANMVEGQKSNEGYQYLPEYRFSFQGVSAEDAAKILVRAAKGLKADLVVDFEWRNKTAAFKPGESGRIEA